MTVLFVVLIFVNSWSYCTDYDIIKMFNGSVSREHFCDFPQLKVKICSVSSLFMMLAVGIFSISKFPSMLTSCFCIFLNH